MNKTTQEVKHADEARSQLSMEVHQRSSKIEKLKKRFEIITLAMSTPDGEPEHSQLIGSEVFCVVFMRKISLITSSILK